jgi:hypothetical protein
LERLRLAKLRSLPNTESLELTVLILTVMRMAWNGEACPIDG